VNLGPKGTSHDTTNESKRSEILRKFGANTAEIKELLAYNQNVFEQDWIKTPLQFPLESEPHIAVWQEYLTAAETSNPWEILKNVLVQLRFPIQEGISQTEAYRAATTKGIEPREITGLILQEPEKLQLKIHRSLAGEIPVLITGNRSDFVSLVQAIARRNEPVSIPDSMGACMVGGYNNWNRIRRYRQQWEINHPNHPNNPANSELAWSAEFQRLIPRKELYQDRFIILSDGFYSNVDPEAIGLTEAEWRRLSLTIRLEHECTHYFTRRVFNSMRNNLLDELIADYRGIVAAAGHYRADWFLHFMGLEAFPHYRAGGRLQNYRGEPSLSDGAFEILQALVTAAAANLAKCDRQYNQLRTAENQTLMLMALTHLTIEELASEAAGDWAWPTLRDRIQQIIEQLRTRTYSSVK
jgi:hypothetical protein